MKIAHFTTDEKFLDGAHFLFESVAPYSNDFFLIPTLREYVTPGKKRLKYIKTFKPIVCGYFSYLDSSFLKKIKTYDFVILHSLREFNQEIAVRLSGYLPIVWIGWGSDYYDLLFDNQNDMLEPITLQYFGSHDKSSTCFKYLIRKTKELFHQKIKNKIDVVKKIDYFSPVLQIEYERILKKYPDLLCKYIPWNYYILGSSSIDKRMISNGKNILVGNSAAVTNNHLDVFSILSKLDLGEKERKIICPLSYGTDVCRRIVSDKGYQYFGDSFCSIIDFLDYKDYIKLLSGCSHVVMHQNRQQAGGNIKTALYIGCRVIINPNNAFYERYKDLGCIINTIDELKNEPLLIQKSLNSEEKEINRDIIEKTMDISEGIEKTKNLINVVLCGKNSS
ncbi:MAG: TDP-N-acetylfucosamine:lipid II N-acetylfucosaminyltransferase [Bacteroidales bacterium]|jgi:hypothetical protein|nr:TDP-N-acetylfucosamine:lipid II N-acetylfucosaminyltransferase [Bacteroidales bacterium]